MRYMPKVMTILATVVLTIAILYHFAALRIFNMLVPKDGGVSLVEAAQPYADGPRRTLDIYRPDGDGPFPVLLFVYGGSWDSGRRQDYSFVGRAFAAQGYLTAIADYRLVPGTLYPGFVEDTAAAMTWLRDNAGKHGGDGKGIFLAGHSAGAYNLAQALLTQGSTPVRAVALLAAPLDFLPLDSVKSKAAFSHVPDLASTQPVNLDVSAMPPTLLLHGSNDKTVGIHNSKNFNAKLLAAKREVELKIYDGVGHVGILLAIAKPFRSKTKVIDDIHAFFKAQMVE